MKRITRTAATVALALSLLAQPAAADGGATPGIALYNSHVASLTGQGCTMWLSPRWGDSFWTCPVAQVWRLTLNERTDTVTLRRLYRGR